MINWPKNREFRPAFFYVSETRKCRKEFGKPLSGAEIIHYSAIPTIRRMGISRKLGQWIVDFVLNTGASLATPVIHNLFLNQLNVSNNKHIISQLSDK